MARQHTLRDFGPALLHWSSTIAVLMQENLAGRYKRSKLGVLFIVLEPVGLLAVISAGNYLAGGRAAYGSSPILFFATGILPFYVMFHISLRLRSMELVNLVPGSTEVDLMIAYVIDELLTKLLVMVIVFAGLWSLGVVDAVPQDPLTCALAILAIATLGVGVGIFNGVLASFFYAWNFIYAIVMRAAIAVSGTLYVVDRMPVNLREYVLMNPLSHAVTWFRTGFYFAYPAATLDLGFFFITTFCVLALAILVEVSTREWRA